MNEENRKVSKSGYCLKKTRKRLLSLWLAALLLFIGASTGIYGWVELGADKSSWDYMEYAKLVIGWLGALLFLASGLGTAYTALRDAILPQKSTLARSIRSQLPYPDAAPKVWELFAMVDQDIGANGQWFDKVAVGKEWVLGDEASYIPRIRLFFGRDETRTRTAGNRVNTSRIVELYIMDDRRQCQITTLHDPRELQPLLECISLRAPDALCRPYSEYSAWRRKSDMEWEDMLREYRVREGERQMAAFQDGSTEAAGEQNMTLTFPDGSVTSRVTPDLVRQTLIECLRQGEGTFSLSPGRPIEQGGIRFAGLECFAAFYEEMETPSVQDLEELGEAELLLKMMSPGEVQSGRVCHMDVKAAQMILQAYLRGELPDLRNWDAVPLFMKQHKEKKQDPLPPRLGIMSSQGVFQSHDRFTLEDIEVAAEGLENGAYQMIDLTLTGGYLWMHVQGGDKMDGRCQILVTRADPDKLRYFRNLCTHRQAAAWLVEFARGTFRPDWKEWKDYTRQAEKEFKRNRSE